jgi:hypothetical protein
MNIDNLKDAWANDKTEGSLLPFNQVPAGKTSSVISKIRRNIRIEFIGQIMAYICLIGLFLNNNKTPLSVLIFTVSLFLLLMQTAYYFTRFYLFYKRINHYDLAIKKSIYKIIYELELNLEIYKTFNYCAFPLVVLVIIGGNVNWISFIQEKITNGFVMNYPSILLILLLLIVNQIIFIVYLNWHIRYRYSRYLIELQQIMEDLDEPISNEQ